MYCQARVDQFIMGQAGPPHLYWENWAWNRSPVFNDALISQPSTVRRYLTIKRKRWTNTQGFPYCSANSNPYQDATQARKIEAGATHYSVRCSMRSLVCWQNLATTTPWAAPDAAHDRRIFVKTGVNSEARIPKGVGSSSTPSVAKTRNIGDYWSYVMQADHTGS